jgi:putative molybdopterin biosynthesis protein
MLQEMMNVKEVAQYLRINEKLVYMLARDRRIPATRVTGKWIFPKHLIDEWIESNARANLDSEANRYSKEDKLTLCGHQS